MQGSLLPSNASPFEHYKSRHCAIVDPFVSIAKMFHKYFIFGNLELIQALLQRPAVSPLKWVPSPFYTVMWTMWLLWKHMQICEWKPAVAIDIDIDGFDLPQFPQIPQIAPESSERNESAAAIFWLNFLMTILLHLNIWCRLLDYILNFFCSFFVFKQELQSTSPFTQRFFPAYIITAS